MVWKGVRRRLRLVLAGGLASAWISPFWRGPAPGGQSTQADSPEEPPTGDTGVDQPA